MSNDRIPNLAVQMYSLRELTESLDDVLREVAAAGYTGSKPSGRRACRRTNLKRW